MAHNYYFFFFLYLLFSVYIYICVCVYIYMYILHNVTLDRAIHTSHATQSLFLIQLGCTPNAKPSYEPKSLNPKMGISAEGGGLALPIMERVIRIGGFGPHANARQETTTRNYESRKKKKKKKKIRAEFTTTFLSLFLYRFRSNVRLSVVTYR